MGEMGSLAYAGYIVPFLVLLPVLEYFLSKRKNIDAYSLSDTLVNFCCGILERTFDFFFIVFLYFLFDFIFENITPFKFGSNPVIWLLALMAGDLLAYWHHRLSHEINFLWAAHIVHHQSEELNVTTVFRVSAFAVINRTLFWIWLPVFGFSPSISTSVLLVIGLYQFVSHTRLINKMGFLEYIMVTPSHHRVHHARNDKYIDKNYGHVFIFWDKLFGTFEPEVEAPEFGIVSGFESSNPIWAYFYYWANLFKRSKQTKSWKNKIKVFFMPPAWTPEDVPFDEAPPLNGHRKKYRNEIPPRLQIYLIINILITLLLFVTLLLNKEFPLITKIQLVSLVIASTISFGPLLERKTWGVWADYIKLILIAINLPILLFNYPNGSLLIGLVLAAVAGLFFWLKRLTTKVDFS